MSNQDRETPFFVGYAPVPATLKPFLWTVTLALVAGAAILGYVAGTSQDDPGDAAVRGDFGRQTVVGIVELTPQPLFHVTQGTERIAAGRTLMMTAGGKAGVKDRAAALDGQLAQASGVILQRGDLEMLQLRGGRNGLRAADEGAATSVPEPVDLGRWRLAGEICDGKCLSGAMRPGRGLAHKACANLCLLGGVPAVFVSTQEVEGSDFLMVVGPDGSDLPQEAYDYVAQFVSVEGQIRRHGDLLIFAIDPNTLTVLP